MPFFSTSRETRLHGVAHGTSMGAWARRGTRVQTSTCARPRHVVRRRQTRTSLRRRRHGKRAGEGAASSAGEPAPVPDPARSPRTRKRALSCAFRTGSEPSLRRKVRAKIAQTRVYRLGVTVFFFFSFIHIRTFFFFFFLPSR